MNRFRLIVAAAAVSLGLGGAASLPVEAAPISAPTVVPVGCHPYVSGRTAAAYCTYVPVGAWFQVKAVFVNAAGSTYTAYSVRCYRSGVTVSVWGASGYRVKYASILHS